MMTTNNFLAVMKMQGWRETIAFTGKRIIDPTARINIRLLNNKINIHQMMFRKIGGSYSKYENILCECSNLEEAIEYVNTLDINNLPPNGKQLSHDDR